MTVFPEAVGADSSKACERARPGRTIEPHDTPYPVTRLDTGGHSFVRPPAPRLHQAQCQFVPC